MVKHVEFKFDYKKRLPQIKFEILFVQVHPKRLNPKCDVRCVGIDLSQRAACLRVWSPRLHWFYYTWMYDTKPKLFDWNHICTRPSRVVLAFFNCCGTAVVEVLNLI